MRGMPGGMRGGGLWRRGKGVGGRERSSAGSAERALRVMKRFTFRQLRFQRCVHPKRCHWSWFRVFDMARLERSNAGSGTSHRYPDGCLAGIAPATAER